MRILMLCDALGLGGAETHIVTLVGELVKAGMKITIVSAGGEYERGLSDIGVECIRAPLTRRDPISVIHSYRIIKAQMKSVILFTRIQGLRHFLQSGQEERAFLKLSLLHTLTFQGVALADFRTLAIIHLR